MLNWLYRQRHKIIGIMTGLFILSSVSNVMAESFTRKKNTIAVVHYPIYKNDGTLITGATLTGVSYMMCFDSGTTNAMVSLGQPAITEKSLGIYTSTFTAAMMNCDFLVFIATTTSASAVPTFRTIRTTITDPHFTATTDDGGTINVTGGAVDTVTTATTASAVTTLNGIANNVITAASINAGAITNAKFASGAIDATAIAADAIGASELATDAVAEIAANAMFVGISTSAAAILIDTAAMDTSTELRTLLTGSDTAVSTMTITEVKTAMTNQGYTTARAPYIDALNTGVTVSSFTSAGQTDIQESLTNQGLTTTRTPYLDNLNTGVTLAAAQAVTVSSFTAAAQTDVQESLTNQGYTTTRAPYIDALNTGVTVSSMTSAGQTEIQEAISNLGWTAARAGYQDQIPAISSTTQHINDVGVPAATTITTYTGNTPQTGDAYKVFTDTWTVVRANRIDKAISAIDDNPWDNGTRTLTAGDNIVLAKGTGITGFNDITVASIWDLALSGYSGDKAGYYLKYAYDNFYSTWTAVRANKVDNLDAAISTRGTSTYAGGDTAGTTTLLSRLSAARATYLDQIISLSSTTEHTDSLIMAVSTNTDNINTKVNLYLDGKISEIFNKDISAFNGAGYAGTYIKYLYDIFTSTWTLARANKLDYLDMAISGVTATMSQADKDYIINNTTATIVSQHGSGSYQTATGFSTHSAADVATLILATPANKLATDGSGRVTVGSNADKSGYSISDSTWTTIRANKLDYLDKAISAITATVAPADIQAGLNANGYTSTRAAYMDYLDVPISSRMATFVYTAPPSAASIAAESNWNWLKTLIKLTR